MSKWYQLAGAQNDVVVCTKIALARNVKGKVFTVNLSLPERAQLAKDVQAVLEEKLPGKFRMITMSDLTQSQAISLAERYLVSPEFVSFSEGRSLAMTPDETLSIMICEEDHVKLQALLPGLEPFKAYELVDHLDSLLDESLHFAFDQKLGYLTQCPTNIGTAMRASVLLQLPALHIHGRLHHLANTVSKLGLTLVGAFGAGANPPGSLYQLSNQVTLGISEEMALQNLNNIALSLIEQEQEARKALLENLRFQDLLYRSLGTLKNARVMTFKEFMEAISMVRIGVASGEIPGNMEQINEMIFTLQPATLNAAAGADMERQKRDAYRAERARTLFTD